MYDKIYTGYVSVYIYIYSYYTLLYYNNYHYAFAKQLTQPTHECYSLVFKST